MTEIIIPEDLDVWEAHRGGSNVAGSRRVKFRIRRRDGEVRTIEHVCQPVILDGKNLGHRVNQRDITDRRQAEEALRKSESSTAVLSKQPAKVYASLTRTLLLPLLINSISKCWATVRKR